jgi:hypothetical protein
MDLSVFRVMLIFSGMLLAISSANACVVEITLSISKRPSGLSAGDVIGVRIHDTIKQCNESAKVSAQHLPFSVEAKTWELTESLTFACKVASSCNPKDAAEVEPFTFVYLKSLYEKRITYQEFMNRLNKK